MRIPLSLAHKLLRVSGAHEWIVVLRDTADTPKALQEFRDRYADSNLEFVPWYDLADFYNNLGHRILGAVVMHWQSRHDNDALILFDTQTAARIDDHAV